MRYLKVFLIILTWQIIEVLNDGTPLADSDTSSSLAPPHSTGTYVPVLPAQYGRTDPAY